MCVDMHTTTWSVPTVMLQSLHMFPRLDLIESQITLTGEIHRPAYIRYQHVVADIHITIHHGLINPNLLLWSLQIFVFQVHFKSSR